MTIKLKAFTLMEVTIAMVLAAISIGISFSVYRLLSKAYMDYDEKNRITAEFTRLEQRLSKDIQHTNRIFKAESGLTVTDTLGNIQYTFTPDYITRNQYDLKTDTFFIRNNDLITSFESEDVESGSLIDYISATLEFSGREIHVSYVKLYSAEELMVK